MSQVTCGTSLRSLVNAWRMPSLPRWTPARPDEDGVVAVVGDDLLQVLGAQRLRVVVEDLLGAARRCHAAPREFIVSTAPSLPSQRQIYAGICVTQATVSNECRRHGRPCREQRRLIKRERTAPPPQR